MKRKKRRAPRGWIKRGKRFYFNFTEAGKRIRDVIRDASTPEEADTKVMRRRLAIREGRDGAPDKAMKLDEFLDTIYLPLSKMRKRTHYLETRFAELFRNCKQFKDKTVAEITPLLIEKFLQHRREGLTNRGSQRSAGSCNRELSALSGILGVAVKSGLIAANPCSMVKPLPNYGKRDRTITSEEEGLILSNLTGTFARLRPLFILSLYTGLRRGEMLKLRWSDVNFETRRIRIRAEVSKNKKEDYVDMNSIVIETLKPMRDGAPANGLVFSGKGYAPTYVTHCFSELCDRLKLNGVELNDVTLHCLRHTFSTRLKDNNENPFVIRDRMRHAKISTTEIYTHSTSGEGQEAVRRLEKYAKWRSSDTNLSHNEGQSD
jgi:integrase